MPIDRHQRSIFQESGLSLTQVQSSFTDFDLFMRYPPPDLWIQMLACLFSLVR